MRHNQDSPAIISYPVTLQEEEPEFLKSLPSFLRTTGGIKKASEELRDHP
jgi:hypothetical protein